MQWRNNIGQEATINDLSNLFSSGHLPHALLFLAKPGTGGLTLAIGFARYLLCENKTESQELCGTCAACLKTKNLVHPDLHFTFPSFPPKPGEKTNSKHFIKEFRNHVLEHPYTDIPEWLESIGAKDKQTGNISAEECKEMIPKLNLKAMEGQYKIQIIWRPEFLGKEGNMLLKLLEEPPINTIFILVAEDANLLLDTILSRTQLIRLKPLSNSTVQQILVERYNIDPNVALKAAILGQGNVSLSLKNTHDADLELLQMLKDWFNGIFTFNGNLIGKWVDQASKLHPLQLKSFLVYTQQLMSHTLRLNHIPNYHAPVPEDDIQFITKLAARQFNAEVFEKMDKLLGDAVYHIERNANVKVVLLHLSVALQYALKGMDLKI